MKKLLFLFLLIVLGLSTNAQAQQVQSDTVFLKNGSVLLCKVESTNATQLVYSIPPDTTAVVFPISMIASVHYHNGVKMVYGDADRPPFMPGKTEPSASTDTELYEEGEATVLENRKNWITTVITAVGSLFTLIFTAVFYVPQVYLMALLFATIIGFFAIRSRKRWRFGKMKFLNKEKMKKLAYMKGVNSGLQKNMFRRFYLGLFIIPAVILALVILSFALYF